MRGECNEGDNQAENQWLDIAFKSLTFRGIFRKTDLPSLVCNWCYRRINVYTSCYITDVFLPLRNLLEFLGSLRFCGAWISCLVLCFSTKNALYHVFCLRGGEGLFASNDRV